MTHALDPETVDERDPQPSPVAPAPAALADDALAEEIELYGEAVGAASESEGPLPEGELDRVLGVDETGR